MLKQEDAMSSFASFASHMRLLELYKQYKQHGRIQELNNEAVNVARQILKSKTQCTDQLLNALHESCLKTTEFQLPIAMLKRFQDLCN